MSFDNTRVGQQNPDSNSELKRTTIQPETPMQQLRREEIGIRSGIKGREIRDVIDRAIYKLIYLNMRTITLKAIGNACNKLLSIADIIRRKVKDLYQVNHTYNRKYIAKYESEDGKSHVEKEFRLPCLDITLSLDAVDTNTPGYVPPLPVSELEPNYIDPQNNDQDYYYVGFWGKGPRRRKGGFSNYYQDSGWYGGYGGGYPNYSYGRNRSYSGGYNYSRNYGLNYYNGNKGNYGYYGGYGYNSPRNSTFNYY